MDARDGTHAIEKLANEKYIHVGVIIDSKLTFRDHIASKINLANINLGIIFRAFTFLDTEMFLTLYKTLVRPHLEYATVVWSPLYKKRPNNHRKCSTACFKTSKIMQESVIPRKTQKIRFANTRIQKT